MVFDFFNDFKDTRNYLRSFENREEAVGAFVVEQARQSLKVLESRYEEYKDWMRKREANKRSK